MRMSKLFSQTLREAPGDAEIASHQLLLRAGYIRQLAAGIFSYLPLARRVMNKIEIIIREEMDAIDGQELTMPVVHPADIWKESGRWETVDVLTRFKDSGGRDMALAVTHEEVVTALVRREIRSYRQLPAMIYHIQTKWRDEPRPRAGLIRTREFTMKDSYSLDSDDAGLDKQYAAHYQAYFNIYNRCGIDTVAVQSDLGVMGGKEAHEFMYLTPVGEDTLLVCDACGYMANREVARFQKTVSPQEGAKPIEKVATPDTKTIEALSKFLGIPESKTAKAVFMVATVVEEQGLVEKFIFAVVRGDMDLNEIKLMNIVRAAALRPATEEEIRAIGAVPGYGSPVGVKNCVVVVDDAITRSKNLVAGANEEGFHYQNVNLGRDYTAHFEADIVTARDGDPCPECSRPLQEVRGVEVGNIFKLGTRYSAMMGATFQDAEGKERPVVMGSYGIGVGRLMACIAEEYHDDDGLIWPVSVAPYDIHLVLLPGGESDAAADNLYADLTAAGYEVLYDDRDERAGVKFKDADLIGIPLRITVSKRSLEQRSIEYKRRDQSDRQLVKLEDVLLFVQSEIAALRMQISARIVPMTLER